MMVGTTVRDAHDCKRLNIGEHNITWDNYYSVIRIYW